MKDGHAQAFTLGTTIPASSIMDLASSRDIKVLDLGDAVAEMRKINPGYTAIDLPANTYAKQDKAVKQIGYAAHLIASCKLPAEHVYTMTKGVAAAMKDLSAVNKAMENVRRR